MKKNLTTVVLCATAFLGVESQNFSIKNPQGSPWGMNIDIDWAPDINWSREFSLTHNKTKNLFSFGAFATGGNLNYGYIGGNAIDYTNNKTPWMVFKPSGYVGIGTTNPQALLDVGGYKLGNNFENELKSVLARLNEGNTIGEGTYLGVKSYTSERAEGTTEINVKSFAIEHKFYGELNNAINFHRGGSKIGGHIGISVYMGKEVCKFKYENSKGLVEVNGILRAQEVKVEAENWAWPDFVFSSDYNLRKLSEVEAHINEHKHLPDMPSEAQVKEEGVNLAEMQAKLLQKIEELTLYTIQQEKRIQELEKKLNNNN